MASISKKLLKGEGLRSVGRGGHSRAFARCAERAARDGVGRLGAAVRDVGALEQTPLAEGVSGEC